MAITATLCVDLVDTSNGWKVGSSCPPPPLGGCRWHFYARWFMWCFAICQSVVMLWFGDKFRCLIVVYKSCGFVWGTFGFVSGSFSCEFIYKIEIRLPHEERNQRPVSSLRYFERNPGPFKRGEQSISCPRISRIPELFRWNGKRVD